MLGCSLTPKARRRRGIQRRSCCVAAPSQAVTFFGRCRQLGRTARAGALAQARQALLVPRLEPAVGGGVANGKKGSQLVQALAPVVAQQGLGPAALARVFGVVAARLERCHFVSSQGKGGKHRAKIRPQTLCDYFCLTT